MRHGAHAPFMLQHFFGKGLLLAVSAQRHVLLKVGPLLLQPKGENLLLLRPLPLCLKFPLEARSQPLQLLFPLVLNAKQHKKHTLYSKILSINLHRSTEGN